MASLLVAVAVAGADAQQPVTIRGTVISRGRPVQDITVRLYRGGRDDDPIADVTDSTGTFSILVPGSPDTEWQTLTIVIAPRRSHKGLVTRNVRRDPQRQLGPYEVESNVDATAADLGACSMLSRK